MKKTLLSILALALVFVPGLILADNNSTIEYLKNQNQNAWISQALAAAEVAEADLSYIDYQTDDLMTAVKNILVLAAWESSDEDSIKNFLEVIDDNKNSGQFGSPDLLNDDFWTIMALASVGKTDNLENVKSFILDKQNNDGGWGWSPTVSSDSNDTAAAIMALLDLGFSSSSDEIVAALNYLENTQNEDGGFAYDTAGASDGASTAWVISALNKADIEASTWQKGNNNPSSFLENLRQSDGSFLWMPEDENGSAMVTAYALLALSGSSYPVKYIEIADEVVTSGHSLRIEGPDNTICLANGLDSHNVLDILKEGADLCDIDYVIEDSAYGSYVSSIGGVEAEGLNGWQYFVDWKAGNVAAADYTLTNSQSILWAYGGFPIYPVKAEIESTSFDVGDTLLASFKYYDGEKWSALALGDVVFGNNTYQTNSVGTISISLTTEGIFPLYSQVSDTYVRSNKEYIVVGNGISKMVDLYVEIEEEGPGSGGNGDTIAFNLDRSSIDFGTLSPGQSSDTILSLTNTGDVDIYIEASILGDEVFQDFTSLDDLSWQDYNLNLPAGNIQAINVDLSIPNTFNTLGSQEGQLVFWAINQ